MGTKRRHARERAGNASTVGLWAARVGSLVGLGLGLAIAAGCSPVRPEQRAILADKIMRFGADARARAALEHALENREGSLGGSTVQGGGCGCN
jgi:uncharacterized protein DUF4266